MASSGAHAHEVIPPDLPIYGGIQPEEEDALKCGLHVTERASAMHAVGQ